MNTITILWVDIELDSEQMEDLRKSLLATSDDELASDYTNIIIKLKAKMWYDAVSDLLWYTSWTLSKLYDEEEERDVILDDTKEWLDWKADYMKD